MLSLTLVGANHSYSFIEIFKKTCTTAHTIRQIAHLLYAL